MLDILEPLEINLKACRANAELDQTQMAEILGVTKQTIGNWESGKSEPNVTQLREISRLSGIPISYIVVKKSITNGQS